jgi:hypothetical protein
MSEGPLVVHHAIKDAKVDEASKPGGENVRRHADPSLKVPEVPGAEE